MSKEAAAAGSALGGFLGFKGAQAAAKAARQTAEYNAKLAENEAILVARQKVDEEKNLRINASRVAASQRAATAASGIEMSGSALQALADTYFSTEQDALRIQYSADVAKTAAEAQATLTRAEGAARSSALKTQGYQSLLSGGQQSAQIMS